MTIEKSNISKHGVHKEVLVSEQGNLSSGKPLPEEASKLLDKLRDRPESEIMNSEALRLVRVLWPNTFNVSDPKPLKIGIHKDMIEAELLPPHIISLALRFFTSMGRYLERLTLGASRINLEGKAAGRVKLREAVDAEIKLYTLSSDYMVSRDLVVITKARLLSKTSNSR